MKRAQRKTRTVKTVLMIVTKLVNYCTMYRRKKIPKRIEAPSPTKRTINIREDHEQKFETGYDSDGEKGPFWNATRLEGPQLSDDEDDYDDDDDDDDNKLREELVCDVPKDYSLLTVEITTSRIGVNFNNRKEVSGVFQGAFIVSILDNFEYKQYFKVDDEIIEVDGILVSNKREANVAILAARTKLPYSLQLKRTIVAQTSKPVFL